MKRIHIIVTGTVTGVGFRWWLKMEAEKRNIYGFVKNRTENEVEAVFLGEDKNVDELVKLARKGPSSARVENLNIQNYQKEYLRKSFDILHD